MSEHVLFHDIPGEAYPVHVQFINADTGVVLDDFTIDGPGATIVPGYVREGRARAVRVIVEYADGNSWDSHATGT